MLWTQNSPKSQNWPVHEKKKKTQWLCSLFIYRIYRNHKQSLKQTNSIFVCSFSCNDIFTRTDNVSIIVKYIYLSWVMCIRILCGFWVCNPGFFFLKSLFVFVWSPSYVQITELYVILKTFSCYLLFINFSEMWGNYSILNCVAG